VAIPAPELAPEPVVAEPNELLRLEPVLGAGAAWLPPPAGFVEGVLAMPTVAPPVAAVPQGRPFVPTRPGAGFGFALPAGVPTMAVAPPVAPMAAPGVPPLCAKARPVPPRRTTVASKAKLCRVCGISELLCRNPRHHANVMQPRRFLEIASCMIGNGECVLFRRKCSMRDIRRTMCAPMHSQPVCRNARRREIFRRRIY
jgi:hypothetical protein